MESKTEKISKDKMIQALSYVEDFINSLSLAGYEAHKKATACVDNLNILKDQLQAEDKDGMD